MRLQIFIVMTRVLCEVLAYLETENFPFNIGTVLFTYSDTKRPRWTKKDIALLRARRHFQSLIPHLNMMNTQNEKYVDVLLNYLKSAYQTIKREAPNPETDSIMTTALSDVIGGYLKVRALPVTKFSFYGGSISEDDAVKLFKFHDEIKEYMGTDGKGWKDADPNILNSVAINIAPRRDSKIRSLTNPCEHLAYYEKTPRGLRVPTPFVNWNDKTNTMFVPLKNLSLVALESPNATNALFRYYDVARSCMETSSVAEQENFDQRFQSWLADDVVPHLSDDRLYLALGSVLTLVNTTRSLYDTVVNLYSNCASECKHKFSIAGFPIDLGSKKVMVIVVILCLEIAWCIPALIYILCKKRKKDGCSNVYLYVDPKPKPKPEKKVCTKDRIKLEKQPRCRPNRPHVSTATSIIAINSSEQMVYNTKQKSCDVGTRRSSVCKCSIATGVQSFFSSKVNSTEVARVFYDSPMVSLKSSLKKVSSDKIEVIKEKPQNFQQSSSVAMMHKVEAKPKSDKVVKIGTQTSNRTDKNRNICLKNLEDVCNDRPCTCLEDDCVVEPKRQKRIPKPPKSDKTSKTTVTRSDKDTVTNSKMTRFQPQNEIKVTRGTKGIKLSTGKPYVEITIDRPQTEISVGITNMNDTGRNTKPSKIPKRTSTCMQACTSPKSVQNQFLSSKKTLIPQPKRRVAVDDIIIKNRGTSMTGKLNTTI